MKVLGESGHDTLICEVSKSEIERLFNCYYRDQDPKRKEIRELKTGMSFDLGAGYNHMNEINRAFEKIKEFVQANETVINAISSGLILIAKDSGESL